MNKFALCLAAAALFAIPSSDAQAGFGWLSGGCGHNSCNSCCDNGCNSGCNKGCFGGLFSCFHKKSCCQTYECCQPTCCSTCNTCSTCDTCHAAPTCCGATPSCCGGDAGHGEVAPPPADMGPQPTPAVAPAPPAAE